MADADRLAAALRYQQDQAMPSPLAAAIQSPEYIGGALRDPQFYGDIGRRLSGLLKGGLQDILPTGAGPIMAKQGYEADPNYMQKMNDVGLAGMTVFHGSPYKFDKFDMSKIGTGEGAQAYGHGLYLAESPQVAKEYQKALAGSENGPAGQTAARMLKMYRDPESAASVLAAEMSPTMTAEARQHTLDAIGLLKSGKANTGNLYKVDLPDEHIAKMLDWDKPLSQQSQTIQQNIYNSMVDAGFDKPLVNHILNNKTGSELLNELAGRLSVRNPSPQSGNVQASEFLRNAGVPGIRYLDAGSRTGGARTSNFVVFDDKLPKIIGRE